MLGGGVGKEKRLGRGMCMDFDGPGAGRRNTPRKHLQRPRMDNLAAGGREKLGERGRTLMGRASRPALVNREARVQIRLPVELLLVRPVSARVMLGAQALVLAGQGGAVGVEGVAGLVSITADARGRGRTHFTVHVVVRTNARAEGRRYEILAHERYWSSAS